MVHLLRRNSHRPKLVLTCNVAAHAFPKTVQDGAFRWKNAYFKMDIDDDAWFTCARGDVQEFKWKGKEGGNKKDPPWSHHGTTVWAQSPMEPRCDARCMRTSEIAFVSPLYSANSRHCHLHAVSFSLVVCFLRLTLFSLPNQIRVLAYTDQGYHFIWKKAHQVAHVVSSVWQGQLPHSKGHLLFLWLPCSKEALVQLE
jgi:hypothetical protein